VESKDSKIDEYLQNLEDPKFYIESNLSIINKDSQDVPFIFNPIQNRFMEERAGPTIIGKAKIFLDAILKARKEGFSSLIAAIWLHACVFQKNTKAVIMSEEDGATKRLLERVDYYIKSSKIKIKLGTDSKEGYSFPETNSTMWIGTAGQKAFGRGDDITHLHCSEYLFYPNFGILTGVQEAMRNGGWCVLESTANGSGTEGHKFWEEKNNFKKHFYGWQDDPQYCSPDNTPFELDPYEKAIKESLNLSYGQLRWARQKKASMIKQYDFPQEYPANEAEAFLTSGAKVFPWPDIKRQADIKRPYKWKCNLKNIGNKITIDTSDPQSNLTIWRTPNDVGREQLYLITADFAEGIIGADLTSMSVWDIYSWEQVAHWHGYREPSEAGQIMYDLGCYYNWATLAPETNMPGNVAYAKLKALGYPKMWQDSDQKPWKTTQKTRPLIISAARVALQESTVIINSPQTIAEIKTFVKAKNGKLEADTNCHDDCVIDLSIACYILKMTAFTDTMLEKVTRKPLREILKLTNRKVKKRNNQVV